MKSAEPLKSKKFLRGFTVLELLIVIAIIGLLAGIVLVSFSGTGEQARIAQGLQFADTMRASLQADMVGWWTLDETSGSTAHDNWFDQNDGTVYGAQWVEGIVNNALEFDGDGDYVGMGNKAISGENLTVAAWIKPEPAGVQCGQRYGNILTKGANGASGDWMLTMVGDQGAGVCKAQMRIRTSGTVYNILATSVAFSESKWHFVVGVWDGVWSKIYINGKESGSAYGGAPRLTGSENITIGGLDGGSYPFKGKIDEAQIYNSALTFSQINQLYVQGLQKYQNLVKK